MKMKVLNFLPKIATAWKYWSLKLQFVDDENAVFMLIYKIFPKITIEFEGTWDFLENQRDGLYLSMLI